jgi:hypothetical protein
VEFLCPERMNDYSKTRKCKWKLKRCNVQKQLKVKGPTLYFDAGSTGVADVGDQLKIL